MYMRHMWMGHVFIWLKHVYKWGTSHVNEAHVNEARHYIWMRHVYEWGTSLYKGSTSINEACRIHEAYMNEAHCYPPGPMYDLCSLPDWQISGNRFTYRSVQKYKNPFRRIKGLKIWSSAKDHALLDLLLNIVESFISYWSTWSARNVVYEPCTSSQETYRRGWPLNIFAWFIRAGGYNEARLYVWMRHFAHEWNTCEWGTCACDTYEWDTYEWDT